MGLVIVTVTVAELVQPFNAVPTTVYVVVTRGRTRIFCMFEVLAGGHDQTNVVPIKTDCEYNESYTFGQLV